MLGVERLSDNGFRVHVPTTPAEWAEFAGIVDSLLDRFLAGDRDASTDLWILSLTYDTSAQARALAPERLQDLLGQYCVRVCETQHEEDDALYGNIEYVRQEMREWLAEHPAPSP